MAVSLGSEEDDIIADINVTPLVDVTLVLLIIFMVTATYIVTPSIQVDLPKAATGDEAPSSTLAIVLTADARLYLNGEETTEEALADAVFREHEANPGVQAIISADKDITHGYVVRLIDLVKLNGVSRFAINIDPEVVDSVRLGRTASSGPDTGGAHTSGLDTGGP